MIQVQFKILAEHAKKRVKQLERHRLEPKRKVSWMVWLRKLKQC